MSRTRMDPSRRRRTAGAAVALALPAVLAVSVASQPTGPHHPGLSSAWASTTTSGSPETSLAAVRTIIGADSGAAKALTGKGVGIALIDTGVAPVPGLPATSVVNGPDLSFESQAPSLRYLDTFGHGTHLAGIIVGDDKDSGAKGVAPGAKLTSVKIGTSSGAVDVSQMIAAIDWVVKHRNDDPANPIRVINLSYGSGGNPPNWTDPLQFAAEKAWQAGILVVAAAGNDGNTAGKLTNPATDEWLLAVGATATNGTVATADDTLATFTNLSNGGNQVDVLAPGTSIASLRDPGSNIDNTYPTARVGTTLFKGSGTSQATAVVSAAAALVFQAKPTASPEQVKDWLIKGGTFLPTGKAGTMGLLELNVNGALARLATTVQKPTWSTSSGTGSLEAARGTSHVVLDNIPLTGERTVWGPVASAQWAPKSAAQTSWSGGTWMGFRIAGDDWSGTSWASKTWAGTTWTASAWSSNTTWTDPAWSGRTWSGRTWSAGAWSGRTWSSDEWSTAQWR
ncbi:S8 family serine peptidase [Dactylosporangium sp. NPDC049525]|uniref:S8 family serine peptidase n=1 Tax=Dactylosporangium sp. NPDC049525 TaxID=3154730 RepID=UPI00342AA9F8